MRGASELTINNLPRHVPKALHPQLGAAALHLLPALRRLPVAEIEAPQLHINQPFFLHQALQLVPHADVHPAARRGPVLHQVQLALLRAVRRRALVQDPLGLDELQHPDAGLERRREMVDGGRPVFGLDAPDEEALVHEVEAVREAKGRGERGADVVRAQREGWVRAEEGGAEIDAVEVEGAGLLGLEVQKPGACSELALRFGVVCGIFGLSRVSPKEITLSAWAVEANIRTCMTLSRHSLYPLTEVRCYALARHFREGQILVIRCSVTSNGRIDMRCRVRMFRTKHSGEPDDACLGAMLRLSFACTWPHGPVHQSRKREHLQQTTNSG